MSLTTRDCCPLTRSLKSGPWEWSHTIEYKLTIIRQPGQGGAADPKPRDLRTQLLEAEAAHFEKTTGKTPVASIASSEAGTRPKRLLEAGPDAEEQDEDQDAKRRRVLEETRDIDADSDGSEEEESSDEERSVFQGRHTIGQWTDTALAMTRQSLCGNSRK